MTIVLSRPVLVSKASKTLYKTHKATKRLKRILEFHKTHTPGFLGVNKRSLRSKSYAFLPIQKVLEVWDVLEVWGILEVWGVLGISEVSEDLKDWGVVEGSGVLEGLVFSGVLVVLGLFFVVLGVCWVLPA